MLEEEVLGHSDEEAGGGRGLREAVLDGQDSASMQLQLITSSHLNECLTDVFNRYYVLPKVAFFYTNTQCPKNVTF